MSRIIAICNAITSTSDRDITVAVHNGKFHADEILALVWLRMAGVVFSVARTRDPEIYEKADLVFDLGGKNEGRFFDHHQRDFNVMHLETMDATTGEITRPTVKFAACGLVYDDLKDHLLQRWFPMGTVNMKEMLDSYIMNRIVIPVDASDNGQTGQLSNLTPITLPEIVGSFNVMSPELQDQTFHQCLEVVYKIICQLIYDQIDVADADDQIFNELKKQARHPHGKDGIFILNKPANWISSVLRHWDDAEGYKVCVFPDETSGTWRIQSFPGSLTDRFAQRCSAPADWKGLRAGQFSGFPQADKMVFVHPGGFIGGVDGSMDDAISVARLWIQNSSSNN